MAINVNNPTASGMLLTFDDEFNSNSTSSDNAASNTQWSNHLWYDGADPGAISVANGVLSLASGGELSSVDSAGQGFGQKFGYFEIDMKVPSGVGTWPAFWLMSQQHAVNGANPASEIDIIEGQGNKPYGYYTTLHSNTGTSSDQVNPMPNYTGNVSSTDLSAGYHRFGVLWDPNSSQITYYLDGKAVGTSAKYSTTDYSPDMLLIDNWLGDIGWGGNSPTSSSEGALQIDYVRVYQFAGEGATAITPQAVSPGSGQSDATALASASGTAGVGVSPSVATPLAHPGPESASNSVVTDTSHAITTAADNMFAIDSGGQITENGAVMTETGAVTELAYVNHTLYQEATSQNLWWSLNETNSQWTETSDPLGTSAAVASQAIVPSPAISPPAVSPASSATIAAAPVSVAAAAPAGTVFMPPTFSNGGQNIYLPESLSSANEHVASFNPATDVLDLQPLLVNVVGYMGVDPIADHVINLVAAPNGGTAVMIDPSGTSPTHGTTLLTLDHVLPQNLQASVVWH